MSAERKEGLWSLSVGGRRHSVVSYAEAWSVPRVVVLKALREGADVREAAIRYRAEAARQISDCEKAETARLMRLRDIVVG